MKANEFIRKFGFDETVRVVSQAPKSDCAYSLDLEIYLDRGAFSKYEVYIEDLKHLVESHKLVEKCGGLEDAKNHLDGIRFNIATKTWFGRALLNWSMYADKLEESIADVESCL